VSTLRHTSQTLALGLTLALCGTLPGVASTATTDPVGYNSIALLANSDTYVSIPLHRTAAFVGPVASVSGNVITLAGSPSWSTSQFVYASSSQTNTYYAFIRSGSKEGNYYTVTANSANTLTLDLAGDTLSGLNAGDTLSVIPYWTLGTLFPASDVGTSFTASPSIASIRTAILIPDLQTTGINLAAAKTYFYYNSAWRQSGQSLTANKNDDILIPDTYFIVRNAANSGVFTQSGSVVMKKSVVPLLTHATGKQDNAVALVRPVPVTLNDSGLISSGAFQASTSPAIRKDELLVFDNTVAAKNKAAASVYYYYNNGWRKVGQSASTDFGTTVVFGPDTGVQIRKAASGTGQASNWTNVSTY
jgi:uncharacterized protein (TIGR02597 family)